MAAEFEKGEKIERWERNLDQPSAALKQVGVMMVAESQRAFREQKFDGKPWEPRGPINILGLIQDFYDGRTPPSRRFQSTPVLRDTGRLAASIAWKQVGNNVVEVGSSLPYAGVQHTGGEVESKPLTETVRDRIAAWFRTKQGKPFQKSLGWLLAKKFAGKSIKSRVHKRPIVGVTKQTIADVQQVVGIKIMETKQ